MSEPRILDIRALRALAQAELAGADAAQAGAPATPSSLLFLIGDIHGHLDAFEAALAAAGVDLASGRVPAGTVVVQLGDLVHGGPEGDGCVALADRLLAANPDGRYQQLVGNHDAHYLGGPDVSGRAVYRPVSDETHRTLQRWWQEGAARLALAFATRELGPLLVSHGGLCAGLWHELGAPADPEQAAAQIEALRSEPAVAFRPGWLMTGTVDHAAGVTGPRSGSELAASWLREGALPFAQVHGHEGVWWWPDDRFHDDVPAQVQALSTVDPQLRSSWVTLGGRRLQSIDARLDAGWRRFAWQPLRLELVEAAAVAESGDTEG